MGKAFEQQNNPIDIEGAQCFKMDTAEYLFFRLGKIIVYNLSEVPY